MAETSDKPVEFEPNSRPGVLHELTGTLAPRRGRLVRGDLSAEAGEACVYLEIEMPGNPESLAGAQALRSSEGRLIVLRRPKPKGRPS